MSGLGLKVGISITDLNQGKWRLPGNVKLGLCSSLPSEPHLVLRPSTLWIKKAMKGYVAEHPQKSATWVCSGRRGFYHLHLRYLPGYKDNPM